MMDGVRLLMSTKPKPRRWSDGRRSAAPASRAAEPRRLMVAVGELPPLTPPCWVLIVDVERYFAEVS